MPARKAVSQARRRVAQGQRMARAGPLSMAGARTSRQGARRRSQRAGTARQASMARQLPSMRERVQARPVGLKAEWNKSIWFMVPGLGELLTALRGLFYPQEHLRTMKRGYVPRDIVSAAKDRVIKLQVQRRERLTARQEAGVLRNRTQGLRNTIVSQHARGKIRGVPKYTMKKAA